jgi:hypothetical protein
MEQAHDAAISALQLPLPSESCGHFFNILECKKRGEIVLDELNAVQNSVVVAMFKKWGTDRIGITPIAYTNFKGHKGPVPFPSGDLRQFGCSLDGPSYAETWVQAPGDPDSNAIGGTGDCFHPNEMGTKKFAQGVIKIVEQLKLGR